MQGYYQIAAFSVPREPVAAEEGDSTLVDYILVSRRSRDRAGLRYQRRGIDDDANVANFVETETIMRVEVGRRWKLQLFNTHYYRVLLQREGFSNVFSHVQIRGSSKVLSYVNFVVAHVTQSLSIGNKKGTASNPPLNLHRIGHTIRHWMLSADTSGRPYLPMALMCVWRHLTHSR